MHISTHFFTLLVMLEWGRSVLDPLEGCWILVLNRLLSRPVGQQLSSWERQNFKIVFFCGFFRHLPWVFPHSFLCTLNFDDTEHSMLAVLGMGVFRQTSWLALSPHCWAVFSRAAPKGLCEHECAYQRVPKCLKTSCTYSWISRGSVCGCFRLRGIHSVWP